MLKRKRNIPYLLILLFSFSLTAEVEEEIIVEAKKIDSISDWKADVSSTNINSEEITLIDAPHPKRVFSRVPGVWVSR